MNNEILHFVNDEKEFDALPFTELKNYCWESDEIYRPRTYFKLAATDYGLTARLLCFENEPKAVYTNRDEPIYKDSCLEFFVAPVADRAEYINIECNANGAYLCEFGKGKHDRRFIKEICDLTPRVKPFRDCVGEMCWGVTVTVPKKLISALYDIAESEITLHEIRANFYKCGDECDTPHYIAFAPVTTLPPGFHNHDCLKTFIIKENI